MTGTHSRIPHDCRQRWAGLHEHAKQRVRRCPWNTPSRVKRDNLRACHWNLEGVRFGSWQNGLSASAPVSAWREAGECPDAEPVRETDETEHVKRSAGTKQSHSRNGNVGGVPAASPWSSVPSGNFSTVQFSNQFSRSFRTGWRSRLRTEACEQQISPIC